MTTRTVLGRPDRGVRSTLSVRCFGAVLGALLLTVQACPAFAWPDRPVRLVVGFQAGGSTDVVARLLADRLRAQFEGTSFIVENRPGASGIVAANTVRNAGDRHTLLVAGDSLVAAPLLNRNLHLDPSTDFKPVSGLADSTVVLLAAPNAPFKTFGEMVDYAHANPGKISYVSSGVGNTQHLIGEYLSGALKLDMVHVPSRGGGQAVNDLVGGQLPLGILGLGPTLGHVKAGQLTALAVTVGQRARQLPNVPTLEELGMTDFAVAQWFSLLGPQDLPDDVVERLSKAVTAALDAPVVRQRFEDVGFTVRTSTPQQLRLRMEQDKARWKKLIQERSLKID